MTLTEPPPTANTDSDGLPTLPATAHIIEVGPRDGLQNEKQAIPTAVKIEFIERLLRAGLRHIEVTSFVSPKWVPQLADAADVLRGLPRRPGVTYSALVPNLKGLEAAMAAQVDEIVVFSAASETFCQRNINCSVSESFSRFEPVVTAAREAGIRVRGSISCAVGCPYEGPVSPDRVAELASRYKDLGVHTVSVADTIGVGTPSAVQRALMAALRHYDPQDVTGHYHNTYGQALANVYASLMVGVTTFEASASGLGGCPYAVGATGNLPTEDLAYLLQGIGAATNVDLTALVDAGHYIRSSLNQPTQSAVGRALKR